jgi:hypothetical protein
MVLLSVAMVVRNAGRSLADSTLPFMSLSKMVTVRTGSAPRADILGVTAICVRTVV